MTNRVWEVPITIVRWVDGDTVIANLDLGWGIWKINEPIRLYGINAPERGEEGFHEARDFCSKIAPPGKKATLLSNEIDRSGRCLGTLFVDNQHLNKMLVYKKLAKTYS